MIRVSVVATGMDGASIAAIEPKPVRVREHAPAPLLVSNAAPLAMFTPEPAVAEAPAPAAEAPAFEPARSIIEEPVIETRSYETRTYEAEEQDLPLAPAAQAEPQAVEAESHDDAPLFPAHGRLADSGEKKGFFSLFGRSRHDEPPPIRDYRNDPTPVIQARQAAGGGGAATAAKLNEAPEEAQDDLEIPSFLRRLAN